MDCDRRDLRFVTHFDQEDVKKSTFVSVGRKSYKYSVNVDTNSFRKEKEERQQGIYALHTIFLVMGSRENLQPYCMLKTCVDFE